MRPAGQATILHADLDAFYASVEQLLDAGLRGKAIAVGGGVVLAASYEARAFGVRGGMAGWKARELCPSIRFVPGHFSEYQRLGDEVMHVFRDFTPLVERLSIDEAFLDVAGATHLFGSPARIASSIRRRVSAEIGLPISIGVATTKHLAKVASQVAKPDGLVVVPPGGERKFLEPLPVELVWGVGPVTRARLASVGIHTVGDLAATKSQLLQSLLGAELGAKIAWLATNVDSRRVDTSRRAASVGAQAALGRREPTEELLRTTLCYLSDRVASRMRRGQTAGRTVTVRVRFRDLRSVTRSVTLPAATSSTLTLTEVSTGLARTALADHPEERQITLLAVSVSQLVYMPALQLEFPLGVGEDNQRAGSPLGAARWSVDRSVDAIRARFGRDAVDYAAVKFSGAASVPDAFRALAEHRLGADAPEDSKGQGRR
jgi:DNA polymerase-4